MTAILARILARACHGFSAARRCWSRRSRGCSGALKRSWAPLRQRLPQRLPAWWPGADVPPRVRRLVEIWHRGECWIAVAAFGFIAAILLLDVIGRELVGPLLRLRRPRARRHRHLRRRRSSPSSRW